MYKIIGADGKEYGPVTADQLKQWIAEGRVNAQTRVLLEGTTDWKPLSAFPEFATTPPLPSLVSPGVLTPIPTVSVEINGPAIGLMVTAILGFLAQGTSLILRLAWATMLATQADIPPMLTALTGTMGVIVSGIGILTSILIFIGALRMMKRANYGLAMAVSILAMIPCISPCCLLGLPIGIWSLVVLSKPEVKATFH